MPISGTGKAIIYAGFVKNSTSVTVRVPGIDIGDTVILFDEDSLTELGSQISTSQDIIITVAPLSSGRIIAFVEEFGMGTAGGVKVLDYWDSLTGWEVPEPVDEESVPEEIGLWNPGAEHTLTARYNPELKNSISQAYKAAAILLASEPLLFSLRIIYKYDSITEDPMAVVSVSSVVNARGSWSATIDGTPGSSKNVFIDDTFNVVVTDSEGRTSTQSVTVNPVTGYFPLPPAPTDSDIEMFFFDSFSVSGSYVIRADARCDSTLEVSNDSGATFFDMSPSGPLTQDSQGYNFFVTTPGLYDMIIRVKSNPTDFISREIPVPWA